MRQESERNLDTHTFLLLAHYATFAYQDLLYEYLTSRGARIVTKINFPLPELPNLKRIELYENRSIQSEVKKTIPSLWYPSAFAYPLHVIQLVILIATRGIRYDVVIAEDSLLAFGSLILRRMGYIRKVVYYNHGVDATRFPIGILNRWYQWLDRFSATNADINWMLSKIMLKRRRSWGIPRSSLYWIPASVPIRTIRRRKTGRRNRLVFLGVLNDKNGIHLIPDIIDRVRRKIPGVRLDIIGNGERENWLKEEIKNRGLKDHIRLLGLMEYGEFSKILTDYAIGLAPYLDVMDNLTATSDSMKMRVYLAAGLPVIITRGFHFSDEIRKFKLGVTVPFDTEAIATAIIRLLSSKRTVVLMRQRALRYSQSYDIHSIYESTFRKILPESTHRDLPGYQRKMSAYAARRTKVRSGSVPSVASNGRTRHNRIPRVTNDA